MMNEDFSIICLRILSGCDEQYRKILEEGVYYFFNDWYRLENGEVRLNKNSTFQRNFFGSNLSVQAVVGKNGSGKSSLFELIYRIINNVGYISTEGLYRGTAERIYYIRNIYAELYYEQNGTLCKVLCEDDKMSFYFGTEEPHVLYFPGTKNFEDEDELMNIRQGDSYAMESAKLKENNRKRSIRSCVLNSFFYSLTLNYAMHALNPFDYEDEKAFGDDEQDECYNSWLNSIYDKNDGYMIPLGIEPYKGRDHIDLKNQSELASDRIASLLINAKNKYTLLEGYELDNIWFSFNSLFFRKRDEDDDDTSKDIKPLLNNSRNTRIELFFDGYGLNEKLLDCHYELFIIALRYLIDKTLTIALRYPSYEEFGSLYELFYDVDNELTDEDERLLARLIKKVSKDTTHIAFKVRQVLNLLYAFTNLNTNDIEKLSKEEFTITDYFSLLYGKYSFESPKDIILHYPPSIFESSIYLHAIGGNESIYLNDLSEGQRQYLNSTAAYLYHLQNIISAYNDSNTDRVKYKNVNIFMDEIELCAHPDYQRKFIDNVINALHQTGITDQCHVNIMLSTHSPFVLSDIPQSNILFLENGKIVNERISFNPFACNVNEVLKESFFMENGFLGEFAKKRISSLIEYLVMPCINGDDSTREWNKERALCFIKIVGDKVIRSQLMAMYNKKFGSDDESYKEHIRQEAFRLGII